MTTSMNAESSAAAMSEGAPSGFVAESRIGFTRSLRALGVGSAGALAVAEGFFAVKGRISRVYFADMLIEAAIVASWFLEESPHRASMTEAPATQAR